MQRSGDIAKRCVGSNLIQRGVDVPFQMVKMMIFMVIIYALCWLPLHAVTLVGDANPDTWRFKYIQVVWIAAHWLAMSSCCYNPLVYCWMNARWRNGFLRALRCCPCVKLATAGVGGLADVRDAVDQEGTRGSGGPSKGRAATKARPYEGRRQGRRLNPKDPVSNGLSELL